MPTKDDLIPTSTSSSFTNIPKEMILNFEIFRTLGWKDFEVEKGLENGKLAKEIIKLAEQMFNHQSLNTKIHFGDVKFWEMTARWLNATPPIPADDLGFINFYDLIVNLKLAKKGTIIILLTTESSKPNGYETFAGIITHTFVGNN